MVRAPQAVRVQQVRVLMFSNGENSLLVGLVDRIRDYGNNRPRSLQTAVGCSAIGTNCDRRLGYQLLGVKSNRRSRSSWAANIGTAVHTYLENVFSGDDNYLTEQAVSITYKNLTIPGTADLYVKDAATVIDFKLVGETTLKAAKAGKLSRQYAVQVQLYGLGLQQAGHKVTTVGVLFLPRNRELTDAHLVTMPFDPRVASMALDRFKLISDTVQRSGVDALNMLDIEDAPCVWCDWFDPTSTELAKGCPGKPLTPTINNLIV